MKQVPPPISRRSFLAGAAALAGGMAADARPAKASRSRRRAAGEKLRVAVVGAGGRGADNISDLHDTGAQIVALCDCDLRSAAESFGRYPDAKQYTDWRKLLEAEKDFDAVLVATPDHNHAIISVSAMQLGKHV